MVMHATFWGQYLVRAEYLHCGFLADFCVCIFGCVQEVIVDDNHCLCPFRVIIFGLWLKQFDVAATMQLPCPREKQLRTAARMISVECTNTGDAAASDGARAHRVQGNLGFSLGWWRRRILVSCASADFVRPCGSDLSRIFQRISSGFFLKAFLVFIKIPGKSPAESPQCPERANIGSLPRNPRLSSTANPLWSEFLQFG